MIVMSEVLLLNSKDIEMGLDEGGGRGGGVQASHTELLLVIVCHELIIWRLSI